MGTEPSARFFVCRLIPPRPTFVQDMSSDERAVMNRHVEYWTERLHEGTAIVFGPVADPRGPYGIGIVRVAGEGAVRELEAGDPVMQARLGFRYEVAPMIRAIVRD